MSKPLHDAPSKPPRPSWFSFAKLADIGSMAADPPRPPPTPTPQAPAPAQPHLPGGPRRPGMGSSPGQPPAVGSKFGLIARLLGFAHLLPLAAGSAAPARVPARTAGTSTTSSRPRQPMSATSPTPAATPRQQAASRAREAAHARSVEAARAAGFAEGVRACRERWRAIFETAGPAAADNLAAYVELASDDRVTVAAAVHALGLLPPPRDWRRPDRTARNPRVGPGGGRAAL